MDIINKYFQLSDNIAKERFVQLFPLYQQWNEKINLISRRDINHLYERHVLHSLSIAKIISFLPGTRILDVGTGGGFPGIPLAIMFPEVKFHLVDSIGKKINAVHSIALQLGLNNVTTQQIRAEQLNEKYDFIVSRAVTQLSEIFQWIRPLISENSINTLPNGLLYLKGTDAIKELPVKNTQHQIYALKNFFDEEFFETKLCIHIYI